MFRQIGLGLFSLLLLVGALSSPGWLDTSVVSGSARLQATSGTHGPNQDPHAGMNHGAAAMPAATATPEATAVAAPTHDMATMETTGGHDMDPVSREGVPAATELQGGQPLTYTLDGDVKVFNLTAAPVLWPIASGVTVTAWAYNGVVPGPMLRLAEGDQVRVVIKNELPDPTAVHWHGLLVDNVMDGVPDVTQPVIASGEVYTYEFTANLAGSFMYHSHVETDKQILLGLYAPIIIDPAAPEPDVPAVDVTMMLSEWTLKDGETYPAMPLAGMEPNYFTINGKAFPNTEPINVKVGERVRIRFMGIGQFIHPMHLHGFPFKVVATDGYTVPQAAQLTKDTISVAPGERYDIEFIADRPGQWMLHCHIPHHITNDGVEPGGLIALVNVTE